MSWAVAISFCLSPHSTQTTADGAGCKPQRTNVADVYVSPLAPNRINLQRTVIQCNCLLLVWTLWTCQFMERLNRPDVDIRSGNDFVSMTTQNSLSMTRSHFPEKVLWPLEHLIWIGVPINFDPVISDWIWARHLTPSWEAGQASQKSNSRQRGNPFICQSNHRQSHWKWSTKYLLIIRLTLTSEQGNLCQHFFPPLFSQEDSDWLLLDATRSMDYYWRRVSAYTPAKKHWPVKL